jgi:hypothetical protein
MDSLWAVQMVFLKVLLSVVLMVNLMADHWAALKDEKWVDLKDEKSVDLMAVLMVHQ